MLRVWAESLCVGSSLSAMRLVFAVFGAQMMSLKIGTIKERRWKAVKGGEKGDERR